MYKKIVLLTTTFIMLLGVNVFGDNKKVFRGEILETKEKENNVTIKVKNEFEQIVDFNINSKTFKAIDEDNINKGENIIVVYDDGESKSSYNTKFNVFAITNDLKEKNIAFEVLNNNLESKDGNLRFETDSQTTVISGDNNKFSGEINNSNAIVFYSDAVDNLKYNEVLAEKIIILDDFEKKELTDRSYLNEKENIDYIEKENIDKLNMTKYLSDIFVEFKPLVNVNYYQMSTGSYMVPLSKIGNELDLNINFNDESGMLSVNEDYFMLLGNTTCNYKDEIYIMKAAPVIINDEVYVPLDFFSSALNMYAYEIDGKVLIYDN